MIVFKPARRAECQQALLQFICLVLLVLQDLVGTLFSLAINLTCPGGSNWSLSLAAEVHTSLQQPGGTTQVLSLVQLAAGSMQPLPGPANLSGADLTGECTSARIPCRMLGYARARLRCWLAARPLVGPPCRTLAPPGAVLLSHTPPPHSSTHCMCASSWYLQVRVADAA